MILTATADPLARMAFIVGMAVGGCFCFWLGGCAWWLVSRNPLERVIRAYARLFGDIRRLYRTGRWS